VIARDGLRAADHLRYHRRVRPYFLDGALLFFDRDSGTNVLLDGEELAGVRQQAPRSIQFGITNLCNLACQFCSRDLTATSAWDSNEAFELLAELAAAGVLEVAFGGGEPFAFRGFEDLVRRLHDETPLAVHATTNGILINRRRLAAIRGKLGELRLSIYDDNDWRNKIALLVDEGIRFGVNLLVLPERLPALETSIFELVERGCRDILLLSYNGHDGARHLSLVESDALAARVKLLHSALGTKARLSLDVCWGERMSTVPRLFERRDCGAGRDFVVLTSDKQLMPCSFHHQGFAIKTATDVLRIWSEQRGALRSASRLPGCARVAGFGLEQVHANPRLERLRIQ
jgi:MoaA/NifB/PqqE/SkfB family radical SAM enzyme